ncbi:hypothetical protein HNQ63_000843 [Wenzhouxiangella marina]|nr:hypothetical protein [Wenzhouxiangella marina]
MTVPNGFVDQTIAVSVLEEGCLLIPLVLAMLVLVFPATRFPTFSESESAKAHRGRIRK